MATDVEHEHSLPEPTEPTEQPSTTANTATPPPPPPPPPTPDSTHTPLAGDLTPGWHKFTLALWIMVLLALAAVWSASAQLGLATWWLGPRGDRNPMPVQLIPFLPPLVMQVVTLLSVRWTARYGIAAGAIIVVVGVFDFGRVSGLAWIEIAIGLAAIAGSVAALGGTYRQPST